MPGPRRSGYCCRARAASSPIVLAALVPALAVRAGCPILAGGQYHTVALQSDGTVWAWGWNLDGQLGDGSNASSSVPVQVRDPSGTGFLADVVAVAAAASYSMALRSDGSVWTWGDNATGQLGTGVLGTDSTLPVQVKDASGIGTLTAIVAIAAGGDGTGHGLALAADGTLWSWGSNVQGELGIGSLAITPLPVQVRDPSGAGFLTGVTQISAGGRHNLALMNDGTVWAWGDDFHGQLGDGNAATYSWLPVQVKDASGTGFLAGVVAVAAGAASGGSGTGR